jgi:coenzyme F420-reducing hydrogenase alpha subunit
MGYDFDLPSVTRDIEFVSLRHPDEYPMNDGRIVSSKNIDAAPDDFDDFFEEHQVPYSNALHCKVKGRGPYFLGPLARVNLNFDRLGPDVTSVARETGIPWPNSNPYTSIVARALEVLYAIDEALKSSTRTSHRRRPRHRSQHAPASDGRLRRRRAVRSTTHSKPTRAG